MKLKDYLKDIDNKTRLYIGSRTSFFFIGNKIDFIASCSKIEESYRISFDRSLKNLINGKSELEKEIEETKLKIEINDKPKKTKILIDGLHALEFELKQKETLIKHYTKAVETFKPFREREIIYVFLKQTMIDEQGIAIKLEGYESGAYWTYKEWKSRNKKDKK